MKAKFNVNDDTLILVSLILVSLGPKANGRQAYMLPLMVHDME